jgi:hypothetical protein
MVAVFDKLYQGDKKTFSLHNLTGFEAIDDLGTW